MLIDVLYDFYFKFVHWYFKETFIFIIMGRKVWAHCDLNFLISNKCTCKRDYHLTFFSSAASIISCHLFIRAHIEAKNTPLDPGEIHIYKQCAVKGLDDYWYRALVEKTLDKGKVSRFLFMSRSSRLLSRIGRTHFKYFWFPWESKKIQHDRSKMAAARESWRHSIVIWRRHLMLLVCRLQVSLS